ncbi:MAG: hypothetical protein HC843_10575 [Sphingomonadales bacterium]|nr:hypothetical protein [Sphingomonadales bacterium]
MARPEAWQMRPESYPFSHLTETRFADLDLLGHINNVSMAGLFEHGGVCSTTASWRSGAAMANAG